MCFVNSNVIRGILYSKLVIIALLQNNPTKLDLCVTFGSPSSERATVVNNVVEGEGDDEERAVTGRVNLERHIPLVQSHRLTLLCQ